jgi:hypothetical protein
MIAAAKPTAAKPDTMLSHPLICWLSVPANKKI